MQPITVIKRNLEGRETWKYTGRVIRRNERKVVLEARFNNLDMPFMGIVLKKNDRFIETFYTDRWYNIFEIHDRDDGSLKGWYCNIGFPAVPEGDHALSYIDLALDLWVTPDGRQVVLDREEFEGLGLDEQVRESALNALDELQQRFLNDRPPG